MDIGFRFILVLDTNQFYLWVFFIRRVYDEYVVIQICKYVKATDLEFFDVVRVGSFIKDFVDYNQGEELEQNWNDKKRSVIALYQVLRCWTDFIFYFFIFEEIIDYWDSSFFRLFKSLLKAVNFGGVGNFCCCVGCVMRCLKRKKMKWLFFKEFNIGYRFKLVRSQL